MYKKNKTMRFKNIETSEKIGLTFVAVVFLPLLTFVIINL